MAFALEGGMSEVPLSSLSYICDLEVNSAKQMQHPRTGSCGVTPHDKACGTAERW